MQGYRTVAVGLAMAVLPGALSYLSGIHWENYVPAAYVPVITGGLMIFMRFFSTTPIGVKK